MVLDSKLPEHLAHFGIDMMTMEKASSLFLLLLVEADYFILFYFFLISRQKYWSALCFTIEVLQI